MRQLERTSSKNPMQAMREVAELAILELISQGGVMDHIQLAYDKNGKWKIIDVVRKKGFSLDYEWDEEKEVLKATADEFIYGR